MNHPELLSTLATLQDDLVHIIEELLCAGGAAPRQALRQLLAGLDARAAVLGEAVAARLHAQLEPVLLQLRDCPARAAATLVGIRRGLRNLQLRLQEQEATYPWARELGWPAAAAAVTH